MKKVQTYITILLCISLVLLSGIEPRQYAYSSTTFSEANIPSISATSDT